MPQPNETRRARWILLGLGALVACSAATISEDRAYPGDLETLQKITLTSPGQGEVLVWNAAAGKYRLSSQEDYPIETRTVGCITCHTGQREPHADDLSFNLERMIGCTDCHGGVGWVTKLSKEELAPILTDYLTKTVGISEVTSEVLAERIARFKTVSGGQEAAKAAAHIHAPHPDTRHLWERRNADGTLSSGNPEASHVATLKDSWEWIRFVNPGDLRVASLSCGTSGCHGSVKPQKNDDIVLKVQKSMMSTAPMLWGAALYNNGVYPEKIARWGESYGPHGMQQTVHGDLPEDPAARAEAQLGKGQLERLDPLPRFEIGQPGNILRIFERGQRRPLLIGLPTPGLPGGTLDEEPGRPFNRLSQRGLGTQNRTDPVWLNLQRTRLMDPTLNMMGTNDHPGDYRASGCSGCHFVYANDRDPVNRMQADSWGTRSEDKEYAKFAHHMGPYRYTKDGADGTLKVATAGAKDTSDKDDTLPADEPGHPIRHEITLRTPSAQCVTCHMHPGTAVEQSYLGYQWWDLETDGEHLWPKEQVDPDAHLEEVVIAHNPEGSTPKRVPPLPDSLKGKQREKLLKEAGGDLTKARDLYYRRVLLAQKFGSQKFNEQLENMQLGDFKGHGFLFRAVWDRDKEGRLVRKRPLRQVELADGKKLQVLLGVVVAAKLAEGEDGTFQLRVDGDVRDLELPPAQRQALAEAKPGDAVVLLADNQDGKLVISEVAGKTLGGAFVKLAGDDVTLLTDDGEQTVSLTGDAKDKAKARLGKLKPGDELMLITDGEQKQARYVVDKRTLLDPEDPDWKARWKLAVHLRDIHLERGMHCVDCHFGVDSHGDGNLYGEFRAATAIQCQDCHGTVDALATLKTSGNAGGQDLTELKARGPKGGKVDRFEWRTPGKKPNKRTGEFKWRKWDPTREKTAYRAPEAKLYQQSMLYPKLQWEVPQVMHSVDPGQDKLTKKGKVLYRGRSRYNPLSALAKTMQKDGKWGKAPRRRWGGPPLDCERKNLAHEPTQVSCYSCHTSWMTSCFGCHLDMKANWRRPAMHFQGKFPRNKSPFLASGPHAHPPFWGQHPDEYQRNWTTYSFQTLRTDFFMLGRDGDVSGGKSVPVRSACAVTVGSQNGNRENVYSQQQTVSAEGFSGTAFSPHFPHTVRSRETRSCTDCHLSTRDDNNARLAQTLMLGTNAANFLGRFVYVAEGSGGFDAVVATERPEPQAVIGSRLHQLAYPREYEAHQGRGQELTESYHHGANTLAGVSIPFGGEEVLSVQLRGEYLYTANGSGGLKVYDVAQIDNKGFSERIVWAPVSPLGQNLTVDTEYATAVRAPSTQGVDPTRNSQRLDRPQNREQKVHLSYAFLYVTDRVEGLILVGAGTLLDGDPDNNFLQRAVTFNPGNALKGAEDCLVAGTHVYVVCDAGVVVVDIDDPLKPKIVARTSKDQVQKARAIDVQLNYAFVGDKEGFKVLDISQLFLGKATKEQPLELPVVASFTDKERLAEVNSVYVSRTYAYIGGGKSGMVVFDVEKPRAPKFVLGFTDKKAIHANDVKVGTTNASHYAYIASGGGSGKSGLFVVQLTGSTSKEDKYANSTAMGWSPRPRPRRIAFRPTGAPALEVSEGIDRDRAVDEAGHQTAVFGRIGSRPMTKPEMLGLLTLGAGKDKGKVFKVPPLERRPAAMGPAERALRDAEVLRKFNQGPFKRLKSTKKNPAVEWPSRRKKKKKKKKKKR